MAKQKISNKQALQQVLDVLVKQTYEDLQQPYVYNWETPDYTPELGRQAQKLIGLGDEMVKGFCGCLPLDYDTMEMSKQYGLELLDQYLQECVEGKYMEKIRTK